MFSFDGTVTILPAWACGSKSPSNETSERDAKYDTNYIAINYMYYDEDRETVRYRRGF